MRLQFFLAMQPPTVTHHSKQLHAYIKDGRPKAALHDSEELRDARAKLHAYLAKHRPQRPMEGPVRLVVKWLFEKGSHGDGEYKTSKPDTDNLQKALKDCMTQLGFWHDDAQVASEVVEKFWAARPGIFVQVEEIGNEAEE